MKKFSLFILLAALFLFAGCGDGGNDYDKYGDTGDSGKDDDTADTVPDKDSSDTSEDAEPVVQPDDDGETVNDEDNDGSNADNDSSPAKDFWSTCEGIIACTNSCSEEDSNCVNTCYVRELTRPSFRTGAGVSALTVHVRKTKLLNVLPKTALSGMNCAMSQRRWSMNTACLLLTEMLSLRETFLLL